MGFSLNSQNDRDSEYVKNVNEWELPGFIERDLN